MKLIISLLLTIICVAGISAQTTSRPRISGNNTSNSLLDSARFEIIKFEEITSQSIKLDRYTGKTYLYGIGGGIFNASRKWFLLSVKGGLPAAQADSVPRYDIYEGSEGLLLLNNETGQSWVLINRTWEPVLD